MASSSAAGGGGGAHPEVCKKLPEGKAHTLSAPSHLPALLPLIFQPLFEQWGEYRVQTSPLLGVGLTARVYLAEREGVPYALKRYASVEGLSAADQEAIQSAASAELTLCVPLRHPHIVRAFCRVEGTGSDICLALEYAPGASAKARMRELGAARDSLLPLDVLAWLARDIAQALAYLHGNPLGTGPILHRDIKPSNIVFTAEGEAMLTDFGSAALLQGVEADRHAVYPAFRDAHYQSRCFHGK